MKNTNNTIKANEIKFPTNGNCKKVKDLTTGKEYGSITETAIILGVTGQAVSSAIEKKGYCKGHRLILLKDLHDNIEDICAESAKANARADKAIERAMKAEAREVKAKEKLSSMEEIIAKAKAYDQMMAEKERERKEEEARIEKERKEEEAKRERERREAVRQQMLLEKAQAKVDRWNKKLNKHNALGRDLEQKLMKAEMELEALMDNGKEVV